MSAISWPLQQSLYSVLSTALTPVLVYDEPPPNSPFPYVTIGEQTSDDSSDKSDRDAERVTVTVHAFSRKSGRKEVKEMCAKIRAALHNKSLTVPGYDAVTLSYEFSTDFTEPETMTKHGVVRLGGIVTPTT